MYQKHILLNQRGPFPKMWGNFLYAVFKIKGAPCTWCVRSGCRVHIFWNRFTWCVHYFHLGLDSDEQMSDLLGAPCLGSLHPSGAQNKILILNIVYVMFRHVRLPRIRGIPRFWTLSGSFLRFVQIRGENIISVGGGGTPKILVIKCAVKMGKCTL